VNEAGRQLLRRFAPATISTWWTVEPKMRTGKERSSEIKGDLQITCMLPHSMIPLIYLLAL
jgi:hypothetical protein